MGNSSKLTRVAIITNVIAEYRRDYYQRLSEQPDIDYDVFCQSNPIKSVNIKSIEDELACDVVKFASVGLSHEKLVFQWLPIFKLLNNYDIYFFYGNPRVITNVLWASIFRMLGKKVVLTGHAHTAGKPGISEAIKLLWWKRFSYLLVYNSDEVQYLKCKGFDNRVLFGIENGLDQVEIDNTAATWSADRLTEWRGVQGLNGKRILLSCARLDPKNDFELMLIALKSVVLDFPDVVWCVIGDGEEGDRLKRLADSYKLADNIMWIGAIYDEDLLAPWFLSSVALVHPGAIGLSLLHAFGYGLPVITHGTRELQMPEFSALSNGKNGFVFKQGDAADLADKCLRIVNDTVDRSVMAENAVRVAREKCNTRIMAERMEQLVTQIVQE